MKTQDQWRMSWTGKVELLIYVKTKEKLKEATTANKYLTSELYELTMELSTSIFVMLRLRVNGISRVLRMFIQQLTRVALNSWL